jgi:predicted TIM-barrel fold metal-dependent hydrolase
MSIVVDTHLHIFNGFVSSPDARGLVSLNYGRVRDRDGRVIQVMPPSFERTDSRAEVAIGYMDHYGVDKALLTQGPFYGFQNDVVAEAVYRWPNRFWGLSMYNPFIGRRAADDVERWMIDRHLVGVKVEVPATRGFYADFSLTGDAEMRVWERCAKLNGLLMLHLDRGISQVEQVRQVAEAFPGLRILVCHLGMAPSDGWQEQVRLAKLPNVYLDVAAVPFQFRNQEEYPYPAAQEAIGWAVREVGAAKITWGTDYPTVLSYHTYGQLLDVVRKHCPFLSEEERALILGGAAERMLDGIGPQ